MVLEEITYSYASFWQRLLAHNVDLIPILIICYILSLIIPPGYDIGLVGSVYLFYYSIFEASHWQATPGKRLLKIKVSNKEESRAGIINCVIRNAFKIISLLPFFGGFVLIFFDAKRRGLHDYIGGTLVLFDEH